MLVNILPAENLFSRVKLWTGGILSTAHWAITWEERPVDFVSTHSATTVNGLHVTFAFWFANDNTEEISVHWTGPGEVFSHDSSLNSPNVMCHTTHSCCLILRRRPVLELWQNSLDYLELSKTDKLPGRSDLSCFVTWSQASETSQIVIYWFDSSFTVEHLGNPVDVCFGRPALPVTRQLIHRLIHNFCGNVFGLGVLLNDSRSLGDLIVLVPWKYWSTFRRNIMIVYWVSLPRSLACMPFLKMAWSFTTLKQATNLGRLKSSATNFMHEWFLLLLRSTAPKPQLRLKRRSDFLARYTNTPILVWEINQHANDNGMTSRLSRTPCP